MDIRAGILALATTAALGLASGYLLAQLEHNAQADNDLIVCHGKDRDGDAVEVQAWSTGPGKLDGGVWWKTPQYNFAMDPKTVVELVASLKCDRTEHLP